MFKKIRNAMLALAAVATLGLGALVATTDSADARGGFHVAAASAVVTSAECVISAARVSVAPTSVAACISTTASASVITGRTSIARTSARSWCWRHPWRCKVHVRWPRPVFVGAPVIAATTYAVAPVAAAPRPCTCLTKEYTPDNLVVFKDVCTKEVASAPVGNTQVQLPMPQQDDPTQPQTK